MSKIKMVFAALVFLGLIVLLHFFISRHQSPQEVTAFFTALIAITTVLGSLYAFKQYRELRQERTFDLIAAYESDPVFFEVRKCWYQILRKNNNDLSKLSKDLEFRFHSVAILNHYEGIAHKVISNFVRRKPIKDQLGRLIIRDVELLILPRENKSSIKPPEEAIVPEKRAREKTLENLMKFYDELKREEKLEKEQEEEQRLNLFRPVALQQKEIVPEDNT